LGGAWECCVGEVHRQIAERIVLEMVPAAAGRRQVAGGGKKVADHRQLWTNGSEGSAEGAGGLPGNGGVVGGGAVAAERGCDEGARGQVYNCSLCGREAGSSTRLAWEGETRNKKPSFYQDVQGNRGPTKAVF